MKKRLQVLMPRQVEAGPVQFFPRDVLYCRPNPDNTRKMCMNCVLWMASDNQCYIHDSDVIAAPDAVCGYHVFGQPQYGGEGEFLNRTNMDPVQAEFSGLEQVPGGSSCDTCVHYEPSTSGTGVCLALADPEDPEAHPVVEALGCCTKFEKLV